jgi:GNAT superfamily N-acetyltransferase
MPDKAHHTVRPMSGIRLILESNPSTADLGILEQGLVEEAEEKVAARDYLLLTVLMRDSEGAVRGGLRGATAWNWLHIKHLWVDRALRGGGYGRQLVEKAEREALRRGCHGSWVDTFSFQAPGFYERLGYEAFGELEDFPSGEKRFFLMKTDLEQSRSVEAP